MTTRSPEPEQPQPEQSALSLPLTELSVKPTAVAGTGAGASASVASFGAASQVSPLRAVAGAAESPSDVPSEADIRRLVDAFYETVRGDDLIGPIFQRHVADWSLHLPKMYDFWSTVVLRTGRYAGRPIEVHERLPELTTAHFARWLSLWEQTVVTVIQPAVRAPFIDAARRMALSMSSRLITQHP